MAEITQTRMDAALKRIKAKLDRNFPVGCRVKFKTSYARKTWPKYAEATGTVVRHFKGVSLMVLFDGRKTPSSWHPDFFKRIKP